MIARYETDFEQFGPKLSWQEICERHPSQWVVLADVDSTPMHEVTAGRIAWHGDDNGQAHRRSGELELREAAVLFTGSLRSDVKYLL